MDRLIVERKLDSLQRCIERVITRRPDSVEALKADLDLQDVLVLNISRAVQICVDLATHMLSKRLQDFKEFARTVSAQLDSEK